MKNTIFNIEYYGSQINFPLVDRLGYILEEGGKLNFWKVYDNFELLIVLKGKIVYEYLDQKPITILGGHFALVQSDIPHRMKDGIFAPYEAIWINLNPISNKSTFHTPYDLENLKEIMKVFSNTKVPVVKVSPLLSNLCQSYAGALKEWHQTSPQDALRNPKIAHCNSKLIAWIKTLVSTILNEVSRCCEDANSPPICPYVRKACQYMQLNFDEPISIQDVISELNVSHVYFYKQFNKDMGQTPSMYLRNLRLEKACNLLTNTNKSILDIAIESGFSSGRYLSSVFKKQAGESPSAFRKRINSQSSKK